MISSEPYDLIAILAGDKIHRHPPALALFALGWAKHLMVTGEHEVIDPAPELSGRVLRSRPTASTHEDAAAIRTLAEQHAFSRVLVVTAASQAPRARLTLAREFRDRSIVADVLSWETTTSATTRRVAAATQIMELVKLAYYAVRGWL